MSEVTTHESTAETVTATENPFPAAELAAQEEAEFVRGFTGDETPTEPTGSAAPETPLESASEHAAHSSPSTDPTPDEEADWKALADKINQVDELRTSMEKQFGTAFGKLGGLERTLRELQSATPSGQPLSVSADDFKEMQEEFPELLKMTVTGLNRALGKVRGSGPIDTQITEAVRALVPEITQQAEQRAAVNLMDYIDKDWQTTVTSSAYQSWLKKQPDEYRTKIEQSWSVSEVKESLDLFRKAHMPPKAARPALNRLAAAMVPKGQAVGTKQIVDEEAAFRRGFSDTLSGH